MFASEETSSRVKVDSDLAPVRDGRKNPVYGLLWAVQSPSVRVYEEEMKWLKVAQWERRKRTGFAERRTDAWKMKTEFTPSFNLKSGSGGKVLFCPPS